MFCDQVFAFVVVFWQLIGIFHLKIVKPIWLSAALKL